MLPFDSFEAMMLNSTIFRTIQQRSIKASRDLAERLGEPEWCKGTGMRNTHMNAQAPTVSNSIISGGWSAGIEPIAANIFSQKTGKGTFIRKNKMLENILEKKEKNTSDVWKTITENNGSVQHLEIMTEHEKKVFLTAREINQFAIVKQASQRQKFIDQGQSLNLFFGANSDPKYINQVHIEAWKAGLKGLYYLRTEGVLKGDLASRSKDECASCEA
jgi:ribonucleoside-diphosphate reductase alpha chain